jgi:hypothetical protein
MDDTFQKFPHIEILADPLDPVYKIKYTECVKERGVVRFERREIRVPKYALESLVGDVILMTGIVGKADASG